jgi:hypothetical protein
MLLFTLSAMTLLVTLIAAPFALIALGIRQYRWWSSHHVEEEPPRPRPRLLRPVDA